MDRPILFSAPMVRALLEGRKTQTRRPLKEQPPLGSGKRCVRVLRRPLDAPQEHAFEWRSLYNAYLGDAVVRFAAGDRLWVKETWRATEEWDNRPPREIQPSYVRYEADPCVAHSYGKLRPSLFMPRWASRLTLLVTDVRVERLQDISAADAEAEGIHGELSQSLGSKIWGVPHAPVQGWEDPVSAFRDLWNGINGPDAWAANPWICAVSFTVQTRNIDDLPRAA
ncbi:hypothetical protein CIW48_26910 [Methylobacterium sp. P1-11]|uniref:hypothetical protein n=1 Tax=Methylobacterium sp. P1-11 TaxID=2024616 RepID=UPI0011ED7480|nr:hypothetical protein [Methylobacterium sp. P1-11]KAA0117839.1 hypothetical protein CIW48_26910 [Methylobacterium sp. P1-11]